MEENEEADEDGDGDGDNGNEPKDDEQKEDSLVIDGKDNDMSLSALHVHFVFLSPCCVLFTLC